MKTLVIIFVGLLPSLCLAPAFAQPASGQATAQDHPVTAMIVFAAKFDRGECDKFGVNNLYWDEFLHPTQTAFNRTYACLHNPSDPASIISWTADCMPALTADDNGPLPMSSGVRSWIPCVVDFTNDTDQAIDLSLARFVLVDDAGNTSLGGADPAATASFGDRHFVSDPLAAGGHRTGLMAFLMPGKATAPVMLEWRTNLFTTDTSNLASRIILPGLDSTMPIEMQTNPCFRAQLATRAPNATLRRHDCTAFWNDAFATLASSPSSRPEELCGASR